MMAALAGAGVVAFAASIFTAAQVAYRAGRVAEHGAALDLATNYIAEWKTRQAAPDITPPTLPTLDAIQRQRWLNADAAQPTTPLSYPSQPLAPIAEALAWQ